MVSVYSDLSAVVVVVVVVVVAVVVVVIVVVGGCEGEDIIPHLRWCQHEFTNFELFVEKTGFEMDLGRVIRCCGGGEERDKGRRLRRRRLLLLLLPSFIL